MFTKKKTIIISLLSTLVVGVVCSMAVYTLMSQSSQMEISDLYGTYQFDIRDMNNIEYLAVIPPLAGDANESKGHLNGMILTKKCWLKVPIKLAQEVL